MVRTESGVLNPDSTLGTSWFGTGSSSKISPELLAEVLWRTLVRVSRGGFHLGKPYSAKRANATILGTGTNSMERIVEILLMV